MCDSVRPSSTLSMSAREEDRNERAYKRRLDTTQSLIAHTNKQRISRENMSRAWALLPWVWSFVASEPQSIIPNEANLSGRVPPAAASARFKPTPSLVSSPIALHIQKHQPPRNPFDQWDDCGCTGFAVQLNHRHCEV